jgi:hypothetical protein
MNWKEVADRLTGECMARLKQAMGSDSPDEATLAQARATLKALEIAISLGDEEPKIAEREAADIRAFLELDQAMRSEAAGRALAARLREGEVALEGAAGVRLHDLLLRAVVARLRLVNPRYIAARQRRAESSY